MQSLETIIVVHPFTSDKVLYSTIKARNYTIVTLITPFDAVWLEHCKGTIQQFSDHVIAVDGIIEKDLPRLEELLAHNNLKIVGVVNAFDYSLEYADALTRHFSLSNLDLAASRARCNKYQVNQGLANAQVRYIKSLLINSQHRFEDVLEQLKDFTFPLIVKPASLSAARNHVLKANDFGALAEIIQAIQQAKNIFTNEVITEIVIQEYIQGEEFIVNAVSFAGKHYIAGVFKYRKQADRFFGVWSLNGSEAAEVAKLIAYTKECLDGLKVSYGMTHNEFILDQNAKPYLIEMNNRLAGIEIPYLSRECYQSDEVTMFLDLIAGKKVKEFDIQKIRAHAAIPYLSNFVNPAAEQLDLTDINSQYEILTFRPGIVDDSVTKDSSLFIKVSAALWLLNKDQTTLEREVDLLFSREKAGSLFVNGLKL